MPETIQTIAADLTKRVGEWLSQPDEASAGLSELRERLEALRGTIGAGAATDALRALSGSEKTIRSSRQREAAVAISAALRELGIRVEPGAPLKRVRKATSKGSSSSKADKSVSVSSTTTVSGSETAEEPVAATEPEHSGWMGRRKAQ